MVAIELCQFNALLTLSQQLPYQHHLFKTTMHPHNSELLTPMKTSLAVAFLPFLDRDGKITKLADNLREMFASGVGERSPTPSLADTLDLFQQDDRCFAESSSPEHRTMIRKTRPERAPIQFRRKIHVSDKEALNHGHATGILIEWLEPAEEEFESIEALFEQYDAKVETYEAGRIYAVTPQSAKR
ncbi:hypothetical protein FIBSPDRAFT_924016 [Athelia psychrophila]|uniref:Uncharacterized protein n=1 Tax=Athelia psychrophila TaxID=1759441 RepID=A0A166X811_9AGAM|nr:hypothetical protein FIBSPDRAFT_924016 [Fibularhizoctonia sp. CBS 109695]